MNDSPIEATDTLRKLYAIVDHLDRLFPNGSSPFMIVSRLCEETGELAKAVNHAEKMGLKQEKHGDIDLKDLAKEVQDVLRCALQVARHYGIEEDLARSIDCSLKNLTEQVSRLT